LGVAVFHIGLQRFEELRDLPLYRDDPGRIAFFSREFLTVEIEIKTIFDRRVGSNDKSASIWASVADEEELLS
jgi:hypothetical protein